MGASEFAEHVAEVVVEEGVVDRPVVEGEPLTWKDIAPVEWVGTMKAKQEKPYLPLHSLEGWSNTLRTLSERIKDDNERVAHYLKEASNWIQMAVWEYDRKYGGHANGPAPTNGGE